MTTDIINSPIKLRFVLMKIWLHEALWSVRPVIILFGIQMLHLLRWFGRWLKYTSFVLVVLFTLIVQFFHALRGNYLTDMASCREALEHIIKTDMK